VALSDGQPVHLNTPEEMFAVLRELFGEDGSKYRGGVVGWPENEWRLELNDDKGNQTIAELGQHLVLTYGRLLVLDADEVNL
jgi:hypothetical protein